METTFTAIDFETANADRGSVCAVGLVMVTNGEVVGRLSQLLRPEPLYFDPLNVSIHGIRARDVARAPTFAEFWPTLWRHVSGPLVAHNAAFDMSVLRRSLDKAGLRYPESDYFCTVVMSRIAWPEYATYALDRLSRELGIAFRHHDAEDDAFACAHVALAACERIGSRSLYDLQGQHGFRIGRLHATGYCPCGASRRAGREPRRSRDGR